MMNRNPLVSVLMPCYNHVEYVKYSLESVWSQSYRNIEIIVIDDGSIDGSYKVIRELQARSPMPMVVRRIENSGVVAALNLALSLAGGEYVLLLATDDKIKPNKVERHVQEMVSDECVVLSHSDVEIIDERGNVSILDRSSRSKPADGNVGLQVLLGKQFIRFSPMLRMKELKEIGGFDPRYKIEDWPLYLKFANLGRVRYINDKLTERRVHANNWSTSLVKKIDINFSNAALEIIHELSPTEKIYREAAVNHMLPSVKGALYNGVFRGALDLSREIIKRFPSSFGKVIVAYIDGLLSYIYGRYIRKHTPGRLAAIISNIRGRS